MNWKSLKPWKKKQQDFTILETGQSPEEGDARIIEILKEHGADMSQARHVLHFLFVPTEQNANALAWQLQSEGFKAEVRPAARVEPGSNLRWLVELQHYIVVDISTMRELRGRFDTMTGEYQGDYDGWEAAVTP